jgi:Ca2+-binding RTX toxin-like protein
MAQFDVVVSDFTGRGGSFAAALAANAQAAASQWLSYILGQGSIRVQINIVELAGDGANGHSPFMVPIGTVGGMTITDTGTAHELRTGVDNNGIDPDVEINVDPDYVFNHLWLDPNPGASSGAVPANRLDGYSMLLHEMGHALAFDGWRDWATGVLPGTTMSSYDQNVMLSGAHRYFIGANAQAVYGGPVPLNDGNYHHYGNTSGPFSTDLTHGLMNGVVFVAGRRSEISELDLAILKDSGLQVSTNRADTLTGFGTDDTINGLGGNDIIYGNAGNDTILGGAGNDDLRGDFGNDRLDGGTGNDMLYGLDGHDSLWGGDGVGNDTLEGGAGADTLHGQFGDDIYVQSALYGNDSVIEQTVDILWRNKLTGENHVWGADGIDIVNGVDLDVAYVPVGWEVVGTADFNRDGTSDILWRNSQTGQNHLWHMTGTSAYGMDLSVATIPLAWKIVATADFDGDGYSDILWRNSQTGENHLWHMRDTTVVSGYNLSRAVIPLDWDVVGAADFDNDGHTDILWRNHVTGENHLWYMNDTNFISGVNLSVPVTALAWQVQALTDFNADGHVDILWRNAQTGENHVWYMNNATVTAGYNLSIATVSLDWEIVGAIDRGTWGGTDLVQSWASYTLPEGVENLSMIDIQVVGLTGIGNSGNNYISSLYGDDTLLGMGGDDTLAGGGGDDTLTGGTGADRFVFGLGPGQSTITDFQVGPGGDSLDLRGVFAGQTVDAGNLNSFIQLSTAAGNTVVAIDADGAGSGSTPVNLVTLQGVTGLDALTLLQQGNFIVA